MSARECVKMERLKRMKSGEAINIRKEGETLTETESLKENTHTLSLKVDDSSRPTQNHGNTTYMPRRVYS